MGAQTMATNGRGQYRFPSLAPGVYRLTYDCPGFKQLVRSEIIVSIGFAAEVNVLLTIAEVKASILIRGDTPLLDTQNTYTRNTFSVQQLQRLPNARDLTSLIALTPGSVVSAIDIGGSHAGARLEHSAYGLFQSQNRLQLDGVNATDGGFPGFVFDYGALDGVQLGTSSNDASMPTPGIAVNMVLKSGGNDFKGDAYVDYENGHLQGTNVSDAQRRQGVGTGTRIARYNDVNINIGGPLRRDRFWYFTSFRNQGISTKVTGFPLEAPSTEPDALVRLQNLTYKLTYQLNQRNKLSHFVQLGRRLQPYQNAGPRSYRDAVAHSDSLSWAGSVEWTDLLSQAFLMTTRIATFGSNSLRTAYGTGGRVGEDVAHRRFELATGNTAGGAETFRSDRRRWQFEWTGTLFEDSWSRASHAIRMGALSEWDSTEAERLGHRDSVRLLFLSLNGAPDFTTPFQAQLFNHPLTSTDGVVHHGAFVQDQLVMGRNWTFNAGLRWDYYSAYYPEQILREGPFTDFFYRGAPLANGYSIPPAALAERSTVLGRQDIVKYTKAFGPRVGVAWDVTGTGKVALKASWGRYLSDPGTVISAGVNPVQTSSFVFNWRDANGDRRFELSELGSFVSSAGGVFTEVDRDIGHPWTDNVDAWIERQLGRDFSARLGFVYKRTNDNWELIEQARAAALFSESRVFPDPGPDGILGTPDDGTYMAFDFASGAAIPASVEQWQTPSDYDERLRNVEITVDKRLSNRWSLFSTVYYFWGTRLVSGHPENPNEGINNRLDANGWFLKMFGTYQGPWGVTISPVLRRQAGQPLGRAVSTDLRAGVTAIRVERVGAYRADTPTVVDMRIEKQFRSASTRRLALFFDVYNAFNSNDAVLQDSVTGRRTTIVEGERVEYQRFLSPVEILAPRILRLGFRLTF